MTDDPRAADGPMPWRSIHTLTDAEFAEVGALLCDHDPRDLARIIVRLRTQLEAAEEIAAGMTKNDTDLHALSVEVGQLMQEVRQLKNEGKRHAANVIEAYAYAIKCERHLPKIRGCAYLDNRPCECRAAVAARFPEYGGQTESTDEGKDPCAN